jgi:hypothetical protein
MPKQYMREKKSRAVKPCSTNCVDPFLRYLDLILIAGATLLDARQGSSRDLDHQTRVSRPALALVDHPVEFVTICGNDCSNFEHLPK